MDFTMDYSVPAVSCDGIQDFVKIHCDNIDHFLFTTTVMFVTKVMIFKPSHWYTQISLNILDHKVMSYPIHDLFISNYFRSISQLIVFCLQHYECFSFSEKGQPFKMHISHKTENVFQ